MLWIVSAGMAVVAATPAGVARRYDLPADAAERSIRRFAEQSGLEVFYPSSATRGVRTSAVKGTMTATQALEAMLAGTGLVVVRVDQSGAFSLRRAPTQGARPAPAHATDPPARVPRPVPLPAAAPPAGDAFDTIVVLSPFEVVSQHRGYHAANTMSGTRLNAKLEDLGASISVVTLDQMEDFALLDLNDIFNYEAGTEGLGNFTDFQYNRNFEPVSNAEVSPHAANRIRGLGAVNTTWGNFETSGRVPIDPLTIAAVEISRGPNASIFGIGSPAGTVNVVPTTAHLSRDSSRATVRLDSSGGHRQTIDLNRVLKEDRLAIRGSAAWQRDGFELKPSGVDSRRLNGMVRYRPIENGTLTGMYSTYRLRGNRPNVTLPRETISGWIAAGRPTWDPITRTVKRDGVIVGTYPDSVPPGFTVEPHDVFTNFFVEPDGTSYVSAGRHTSATNPDLPASGGSFLVNILDDPTGFRTNQPLYAHVPTAADSSLCDWTSINLAAPNRATADAEMASVMWDRIVMDTPHQLLAVQAGWFREQFDSHSFLPVGSPSDVATIAALHIDVNERRLDGSPNPHFLQPFFGASTPYHSFESNDRDIYRGQLAYRLDFQSASDWRRWLGTHQIVGYGEHREVETRQRLAYPAVVDQHAWLGANTAHAGRGRAIGGLGLPGPNAALGYFRYYLGDTQGADVDHAPGTAALGSYSLAYGNPTDGFRTESITMGLADYAGGAGYDQRTIVKSRGAVLQSHLFDGRVVTTFGVRRDQRFARGGGRFQLQPDGVTTDHEVTDRWAAGDWNVGAGTTRTSGIVLKPLGWLSLHANRSDSFQPEPVHQDVFLHPITDPVGEGEDYGFTLKLLDGNLQVKVNHYRTMSLDVRGGTTQNIARRVRNIDFVYDYSLQQKAEDWFTAEAAGQGRTLTPQELSVKVADLMRLPEKFLEPIAYDIDATEDIEAEGTEIELHYNPSEFWTVKANFTRQEAVAENVAPEINRWISDRMRVWETIIDPTTGRPWFTEPYSPYQGGQSPKDYLDVFVLAPLKLAQALEGKSMPQVRRYRANLSTRFRLAGVTEHRVLKHFSVGGALRWEGRGIIGYRGREQPPEMVTAFDPSRPIWDRAHWHVDAVIGYRAPIFSGKVRANWQLNVRDLTESGRIQPIAADPDGTPSAYRIVAPRQFILSLSLDF